MRILYIDIDSTRPDHLGCYGYARPTSPNIDALARESVMFRNCYTPDAPCLPSRTAMYSGRFGIQTGVVGHGGSAAQPKIQGPRRGFRDLFDEQGLARLLQGAGLHTAMISPFGQRHAAHWFYAGFNEIHNTGKGGMELVDDVRPVMDRWLDQNAKNNRWYLHVNFWDPHTPYRTPASYGEPFADYPLPEPLNDPETLRRHTARPGFYTPLDVVPWISDEQIRKYPRQPKELRSVADVRRVVDGYDTGIRYVDHYLGTVFERLKSMGIWEETAIIVSADHGECIGDLGIYGEHGTADNATCRIPMVVKWPGGAKGVSVEGLHYNVDLAPTLADLLGRAPCPVWDGRSFAAAVRTGRDDSGREDVVVSQNAHVCQRAVRWDRYLYIRTYHEGFRLFPQEMVFDLVADPREQHDLAPQRPHLCREGAWRLCRWHDAQMTRLAQTDADPVDPMWTVYHEGGPYHARHGAGSELPAYLKRLEATGRAEHAAALRARYAAYLPA